MTALRVAIVACLAAGCRCDRPAPAPAADQDWIEGRLPRSVLDGIPRSGGTLVVRLPAEPPSLDKIVDPDGLITRILERKVCEPMAAPDAGRAPEYPLRPVLAERWDISPDGLVFTFHLRRGVHWHDGAPFDGRDVVATVRKILDPQVRAMRLRARFEDLESIDTVPGDDFAVVARYKRPYFLAFRSLATLPIYPAHILDAAGDLVSHPIHRAPVGTGPFRFAEWKTGERLVFDRWDGYWGRKAHVDRVVYRFVEDPVVAFQLLQRGEFHLFTSLRPQEWVQEMPRSEPILRRYHRVRSYDPNYSFIGWNVRRPFFADRRVRLAMSHLLDREGMRRNFLLGLDRPTTCHFWPESPACDASLAPLPYDEARAKVLLDEAGWIDHDGDGVRDKDGVPFRFTFLVTANSAFLGQLAPYLQQQAAKVGVAVDVQKAEWSTFTQLNREHRFDATSLVWSSSDVVDDPWTVWHSSQAKDGSNYISFADDRVDRLLEQARATLDDSARNAIYRQFGRILQEEGPYTFLYNRPTLDAIRRDVRGLRPAVTWYDLQDAWLEPETGDGRK